MPLVSAKTSVEPRPGELGNPLCQQNLVSLLTVEYDVGEDEPEGTDVFRLEPASDDIIEQLISRREPQVSHVDRDRIAEFSGGNARIALALARTVKRGESVSNLSDRELFGRLFHQGRGESNELLRAAETCSLVYSFDGETCDGPDAELPLLADLSGLTIDELYRQIRTLKDRDLLQKRRNWRAVLPHALANKLARQALDCMRPERIVATMVGQAPERLKKSFSRRLGYLHDCEAAKTIVANWLATGGPLENINTLDDQWLDIFYNVAPVLPEATLTTLEHDLSDPTHEIIFNTEHKSRYKIACLLRSLCFDKDTFDRSALLLSRFLIAEPDGFNLNSTHSLFIELFRIYLSGTHAHVGQRLNIITVLLNTEDKPTQNCALLALNEMLETQNFSSSNDFKFGARPRDFGWEPRTRGDVFDWYHQVIIYILRQINCAPWISEKLREILASNFRGLWTIAGVHDDLEMATPIISKQFSWINGWIAARDTLRFDAERMSESILTRLKNIEEKLRPRNLLEEARAFALTAPWDLPELDDGKESQDSTKTNSRRQENHTKELGRAVAQTPEVLEVLLPELLSGEQGGNRYPFGIGLEEGAYDIRKMYEALIKAFQKTTDDKRNIQLLRGFIAGAMPLSPNMISSFLDEAVSDPLLGPWFPILQCSIDIDEDGAHRLIAAARAGLAPAWRYNYLAFGKAADSIASGTLCDLLKLIAGIPQGFGVAVDILQMKIYSMRGSETEIDSDIQECGIFFLEGATHNKPIRRDDYDLAQIADACLKGTKAIGPTQKICSALMQAFSDYRASPHDYTALIKTIFKVQPEIALTAFLNGERNSMTRWIMRDQAHALDAVPLQTLLTWAELNQNERFPAIARAIRLFSGGDDEMCDTISPIALAFLDASPDKSIILNCYQERFYPSCWSGSLADILEKRRLALQTLLSHPAPAVIEWAQKWDRELAQGVEREREREKSNEQDERFE